MTSGHSKGETRHESSISVSGQTEDKLKSGQPGPEKGSLKHVRQRPRHPRQRQAVELGRGY